MSFRALSLETITPFSHRMAGSLGSDARRSGVRRAGREGSSSYRVARPPAQLERPEGLGGAGRASVAKAARP